MVLFTMVSRNSLHGPLLAAGKDLNNPVNQSRRALVAIESIPRHFYVISWLLVLCVSADRPS